MPSTRLLEKVTRRGPTALAHSVDELVWLPATTVDAEDATDRAETGASTTRRRSVRLILLSVTCAFLSPLLHLWRSLCSAMHEKEATEDSLIEAEGLAAFAAARQAGSSQARSLRSRDDCAVGRYQTSPALYREEDGRSWSHDAKQHLTSLHQPPPFNGFSPRHDDSSRSSIPPTQYSRDTYLPPALPSPALTNSLSAPCSPPSLASFPRSIRQKSAFPRPMSSYGTPSDGAPYPAPVLLYDDPAQPPRSPPFRSFSYTDPDSRDSVDYEDASGDLAYALSNEPEKGEWFQAAGSYQQGVGFEGSDRSGGAKERTMARMEHLERKFGEQAASHSAGGTAKDHIRVAKEAKMAEKMELQRATGVDEKGRLVVVGRRKRSALRWFQAGGAVVVGIGSIGASVVSLASSACLSRSPR